MLKIFISYKRSDYNIVYPLICEIKEKTGAECWFDLTKIETSAQFASVICNAIDEADVFVFMHSVSHMGIDFQNDWTIRELNYAMSKKKRIVLVKLDDTPLENMLLMFFSGSNNVQITDSFQKNKLFMDLCRWSDENISSTQKEDSDTNISITTNTKTHTGVFVKRYIWLLIVAICIIVFGFYIYFFKDIESSTSESVPTVQVSAGIDRVNGFECVDLGLPSGLRWARCNVGAAEPWEYGDFFAWGETQSKGDYNERNHIYSQAEGDLIKYNTECESLEPEDDAASVNMGKLWRMPTKNEVAELVEYGTWERAECNGVLGEKVTGPNGNSIFIPYAGFKYLKEYREAGKSLSFWTSTLKEMHPERAYYIYSGMSGDKDVTHEIFDIGRYLGTTIRAVTD